MELRHQLSLSIYVFTMIPLTKDILQSHATLPHRPGHVCSDHETHDLEKWYRLIQTDIQDIYNFIVRESTFGTTKCFIPLQINQNCEGTVRKRIYLRANPHEWNMGSNGCDKDQFVNSRKTLYNDIIIKQLTILFPDSQIHIANREFLHVDESYVSIPCIQVDWS